MKIERKTYLQLWPSGSLFGLKFQIYSDCKRFICSIVGLSHFRWPIRHPWLHWDSLPLWGVDRDCTIICPWTFLEKFKGSLSYPKNNFSCIYLRQGYRTKFRSEMMGTRNNLLPLGHCCLRNVWILKHGVRLGISLVRRIISYLIWWL